jgi:dephospho-CoA kinase
MTVVPGLQVDAGSFGQTTMLTLGITGGVASGKSLAAKFFAKLGAVVLDADRAGHAVLRETRVRDALVKRWGPGVVTQAGEVDRSAVARRVFGESPDAVADRTFLERLVHPLIRARLEAERDRHSGENAVFALDAALLLEAGWDSACDLVIFIDAPREQRQARAASRGWSEDEFARREASQWPVERKRQFADRVLSNSGAPGELRGQVEAFWRERIQPEITATN